MHVHVNARRWFERTNGNTYHTVSVVVDGEHVGTSERTYGYGDHYLHTAGVMLAEAGLIPAPDGPERAGYDFSYHRFRTEHGITVTEDVVDVPRMKDLHHAD